MNDHTDNTDDADDALDPANTNELPPPLLIDPARSDQRDPLELLLEAEQGAADSAETVAAPAAPSKRRAKGGKERDRPRLPPLTEQGVAQTAPHPLPPPADKPVVLFEPELRQRPRDPADLWDPADRAGNIEQGIATKNYIDHAGDPAHLASVPDPDSPPMILYNPMTYIERLEPLAPLNAYFARNALSISLGYSVINQLRNQLRDANRPEVPDASIDVFSKYQDLYTQTIEASRIEELGYFALPVFNALDLAGVYMRLLYEQKADYQFADRFPVRLPHEILYEMQSGDPGKILAEAYSQLETQVIGPDNPALGRIRTEQARIKAARTEADKLYNEAETKYVLTALQDTRPAPLNDELWYEIPLYMQYRYSTMVFNQICRAAGNEANARGGVDYDKLGELAEMARTLYGEIDSALKTAEVQAAFEQKRLDLRHDIREAIPAAAKDKTAAPGMRRAPRPAPE